MTRIKICGITNIDDAVAAAEAGADELGFNFYVASPRYVSPDDARSVITDLGSIGKVGVFVNASVERISTVAAATGIDTVQLHGDEEADFVEKLKQNTGLRIIKAIRIAPGFDPAQCGSVGADAILLDGFSGTDERGGTGHIADWELAAAISADDLYLAGGLTPENVAEAIRTVKPSAVDLCSRIESYPGKKDHIRMRQFVEAVKNITS